MAGSVSLWPGSSVGSCELHPSQHKITATDPSVPSSWLAQWPKWLVASWPYTLTPKKITLRSSKPAPAPAHPLPSCLPKGQSLLNYPKMFEEGMQRMHTTSILSHGLSSSTGSLGITSTLTGIRE